MIEGPDPDLWLTDSDPIPRGPKLYRSYGSRSTPVIEVVLKLFQVLPPASNGIDLIHEDDAGLVIPEWSQLFTFANIKK